MSERFCLCGEKMGTMTCGVVCDACKDAKVLAKTERTRQKRLASARHLAEVDGLILVHSCLGDPANNLDTLPLCRCNRYVSVATAESYIGQGRCVDLKTRKPFYNNGPILEVRILKKTPRGAGIEKSHIERGIQNIQCIEQTQDQRKIEFENLQRRIRDDILAKGEDEQFRWQIWRELSIEFFKSITVEIPEDQWIALRKVNIDVALFSMSGRDERTSGAVGRNVGHTPGDIDDEDEDLIADRTGDEDDIGDGFHIADEDPNPADPESLDLLLIAPQGIDIETTEDSDDAIEDDAPAVYEDDALLAAGL